MTPEQRWQYQARKSKEDKLRKELAVERRNQRISLAVRARLAGVNPKSIQEYLQGHFQYFDKHVEYVERTK